MRNENKMEMSYSSLNQRGIDLDAPYDKPPKEPSKSSGILDDSDYPPQFDPEHIGIFWLYKGIKCVTAKSPFRNYNGYVKLPENHPWSGMGYFDIDVHVHGGLTFSDGGWIGFDTGHAYDIWEGKDIIESSLPSRYTDVDSPYAIDWNMEMLVAEVENLAEQVVEVMNGNI
jgi:hypothetical protein